MYQEGKFLDWGLTDEGVGLLRGEGCEILAQGLTGLIEYSYQQVATSFSEAHLKGTPRLSVLGPEHSQGWVTDREMVPGCARVRTKCAEKTSVDLWG